MVQINTIYKSGITEDAEKNGLEKIIKRELYNYECYYTGDCEPAIDALADYPNITPEMVYEVFNKKSQETA